MDHSDLRSIQPVEQSLSHVDAIAVGTRLAEFELQGLIGVGGFGMVYRAFDHNLKRAVAIKEYMPCAIACRKHDREVVVRSPADRDTYAAGLTSFVTEARLLARFDHPSLGKVLRFWEANGTAYMVMPLYKGVTLKQARGLLDEPPSEQWLRKVLWSVLQALKLLHAHDIIHRDISPDNILLQDVGPPVLLDLGAARQLVGEPAHRHTAFLKVNYAPIEQYAQADDLREGPWTDIYSLAAVIYGLVRNEPPLPATFRAMRDRMPTMVDMSKTVRIHFARIYTRELAVAIDRAMRVQPSDRPQSVTAFMHALGLQMPGGLESFDWWREAEDAGLAAVPRRPWGWWRRRARASDGAVAWRRSRDPWRKTWQRDSVLRDFDPSRADTRGMESILDLSSTVVPGPQAKARHRSRRFAVVMAALLVVGFSTLLLVKGVARSSAVLASAKPAGGMTTHQGATGKLAATASPVRRPLERTGERIEKRRGERGSPEVAKAVPKAVPKTRVEPVPAAAVAATDKRASMPAKVELCADSNFFTRPMCIHEECKKPEHAKLPICIEAREREKSNSQMDRI